jgi:hypothetical protein
MKEFRVRDPIMKQSLKRDTISILKHIHIHVILKNKNF